LRLQDVLIPLVSQELFFTFVVMLFVFGGILASIRGIFLRLHILHVAYNRQESCKFGCNQSITKGTLLEEHCLFPESFVNLHICHDSYNRLINKTALLQENCLFSAVCQHPTEGFF
jgi:hypothetical protein